MPNANWLIHRDNLDGKINTNYKSRGKEFNKFKQEIYVPYRDAQMKILTVNKDTIVNKTKLLESYFNKVDEFNKGGWITSQSKFRSTVLEEFCGYLFKDIPLIPDLDLGFARKGIFAGIRIDHNGNPQFETKDVDFCVSKAVEATLAGVSYDIIIPIVAIECKTYVDKTMFNEAQFAAQKLKHGASGVKVLMITETNAIKLQEIPLQTPIDQIYVLRSKVDDPIDHGTVWEFFCEVKDILNKIGAQQAVTLPGKLILK